MLARGDAHQGVVRVLTAKRQLTADQLVQHRAQREQVAARVDALAFDVLGRHIRRRAQQLAGGGDVVFVGDAGDAEVTQHDGGVAMRVQIAAAFAAHHDVFGLDVAVDHALAMGHGQGPRHLAADHRGDLGKARRVRQDLAAQRRAGDELGDQEALVGFVDAIGVDLKDVGMAQSGHGLRLALEAQARLALAL